VKAKVKELFSSGYACHKQGQLIQAWQFYDKVLHLQPTHFEALYMSGLLASANQNYELSVELFQKAIKVKDNHSDVFYNLGVTLQKLNRLDEALFSINKALNLNPVDYEALIFQGNIFQELNLAHNAIIAYKQAIKINPDYSKAYYSCGLVCQKLKCFNEALIYYDRAIEIDPLYLKAYNNRGILLHDLNRLVDALRDYDKVIDINSFNFEAWRNRGEVLQDLNRFKESLTSYDRAIEIKKDYAEAYFCRGLLLQKNKYFEEAVSSFALAIEIKPDFAQAYSNMGNILQELKRYEEALASFDRAIELKPDYAHAYSNRGNLFQDLNRYKEALADYGHAIELMPDYAEAYSNRGTLFVELGCFDDALKSYFKGIAVNPDYEYLLGTLLHTEMQICYWQDFEANFKKLLYSINNGTKSSVSFYVLGLTDSLSIQRKASEIWINSKYPSNTSLGVIPKYQRKNKIRIGYYSADFHNHATAILMVELFEKHDKNNYEIIAFSFGPHVNDAMRQRLVLAFDQFIDVFFASDKDIALMSRDMQIDIAIDLKGFTKHQRAGIFSYRAAPIQINYIGYPGTMATEYIDYIIADTTLIPIEAQQYYLEKVVYLPNSYQVNDRKREVDIKNFKRDELGLPNEGFVFCCFNNNYKITPNIFNGWVKILKAVKGSVLWLLEDNLNARINLRKEAENRGLNPDRLIFAKRMKLPEHLARHRAADLFIDTLPYNAHTTASDALWTGLPVLTCMGESFASRVAASLLNAIELPELITTTQAEYEAKAIELANNPAKLKAIKDKLERNRLTTALFDTPRFTRHIEAAYKQIYERYQADLPPDHIYIKDSK
jgi:predicted O-linked N-acetylglucosamine transferase (SPINDLY family)